MRKLSSVCVFALSLTAFSQTQVIPNASKNYIHSITYKTGSTEAGLDTVSPNNKIENISYFDGLGRPVQSVAVRQGGKDGLAAEADLYTHIEYDAYGRETKKYLPLPSAQNDGRFITDPVTAITNYYTANYAADLTGTVNPYSEARFEASPLNRVMEQGAPGTAWAVNAVTDTNHTIKFDYQANAVSDAVFRYDVSLTADYTPTLVANGSYAAGTLYKTITKDENWQPGQAYLKDHTTEEFKDLQGRVILKRTYNSTPPLGEPEGAGAHDTYYVYDDYGNLTYVLPPKVVTSDGVSASELAELCYQYKYDGRNRLVEKKIPGKGKEHIVYNKLDQPILTQDANLQTQSKWLFTKYDAFGRVVYTGLISSASDRLAQQAAADAAAVLFESRTASLVTLGGGTDIRYTNIAYPTTGITELHTINYYDDYAFDLDGGVSETSYDITPIVNAKSLPTGSKVRVLDPSASSGQAWTTTVTYYDEKSRPVYVYSHNTYLDATDKVKSRFDFIGKVLETTAVHTKDGLTTTVIEKFTYDHAGKVLTQTHQVNSDPAQRIADNTYDQLGQLKKKNVGGTTLQAALQNVDYAYNIRGWLKTINDVNNIGTIDLFAFKLGYNEGTTPLYNGNISLTQWKTRNTDSSLKTYNYTYDALNRITSAINTNANYNLDLVNYDKNGNIMVLKRKGHTNATATTFGMMDDLTYSYDAGNKLTKVEDIASLEGFKNGANITTEYTYDQNGNMLTDANKGITGIVYNHLNLPTTIAFSGTNRKIDYIYDAVGTKLKKIVTDASSLITTEYAGNYVYENSVLQFFNTAEGYVEPNGTGWQYVYQYKDHLGNVRLSYADADGNGIIAQTEIREENNFYPFGLKHKGYNNVINGTEHPYGFNGKEENNELGLEWLDFGWRMYDPTIARWNKIDNHAENYYSYSPYNFVLNNPINIIDPDGNDIYILTWFSKDGETGHAGIAIDNYKTVEKKDKDGNTIYDKDGNAVTEQVKDGTVTYYDLWPNDPVGRTELQDDVAADYTEGRVMTLDALKNTDPTDSRDGNVSAEGRKADGIVQLSTTADQDATAKSTANGLVSGNGDYNACTNNCSTFTQNVLNSVFPNVNASQQVRPSGALRLMYDDASVVAPNNLYNAALKVKGAKRVRGPEKAEAKPYLEYFGKTNRGN